MVLTGILSLRRNRKEGEQLSCQLRAALSKVGVRGGGRRAKQRERSGGVGRGRRINRKVKREETTLVRN